MSFKLRYGHLSRKCDIIYFHGFFASLEINVSEWRITGVHVQIYFAMYWKLVKSIPNCLIININQQKQVLLRTLSAFWRHPFKHPFSLIHFGVHTKCPLIFFTNTYLSNLSKLYNHQRILF
jgi:hypothetical protein